MSLATYPIRVRFDADKKTAVDTVRGGTGPAIWRANDVTISVGAFFADAPLDISNFASLTIGIYADMAGSGSPLAVVTVLAASITGSITEDDWNTGVASNADFDFSADDTTLDLSGGVEKTYYLVCNGLTDDGKLVTFGSVALLVKEAKLPAGTPPSPTTGFYTKTEADALLDLRMHQSKATVAELEAASYAAFNDGDSIWLQGYYSRGDGGGGMFRVTKGDSTSRNGGTVFVASDGARLIRQIAGPVNVRWFGAKGNGVEDDLAKLQVAIDYVEDNGIQMLQLPSGTYLVSGDVVITSCHLIGDGGHLSKTIIKGTATSGSVVTMAGRSSGLVSVRVDASSGRRAAGAVLDGGVLMTVGDVVGSKSMSRAKLYDVYITNQPGYGLYITTLTELADFRNVTAQGCKGHPFIFDDGTTASFTNKDGRQFMLTFYGFRALECGGNIVIGASGQTSIPYQLRFVELEALDCAFDSSVRLSTNQVICRAYKTIFDRPDIENQRYAATEDMLGNSKTGLAAPVKGFLIAAHGVLIEHPYFSSLAESCEVGASWGGFAMNSPEVIAGTYGVAQAAAVIVPSSVNGVRLHGVTQPGATVLFRNQSPGADIYMDGRRKFGTSLSASDWDVDLRPQAATIASGTLEVPGNRVNVAGQGGVADDLVNIRIASGVNGLYCIDVYLLNKNGYDITLKHGTGNLVTNTGADVVLNASNPVAHFIWDDTQTKWFQL